MRDLGAGCVLGGAKELAQRRWRIQQIGIEEPGRSLPEVAVAGIGVRIVARELRDGFARSLRVVPGKQVLVIGEGMELHRIALKHSQAALHELHVVQDLRMKQHEAVRAG